MRAFIYTGGEIYAANITERPEGEDLVIAADSGYRNAVALGVRPAVLLGDFDSLGKGALPDVPEILQLPPEKDRTDTQLAVDLALSRGAREIVIIGGLSGRLDHTVSNLSLLEGLSARGVYAILTDGQSRVRFVKNSGALIGRSGFTYLSVLAVSPVLRGVTVQGCKYPLKNETLTRDCQYAVSNEITGNCALVEIRRGEALIVESCDRL